MELLAVIEALSHSSAQQIPIHYSRVEIRTDSRYVVDNKVNAIYYWPQTKWYNQDGKPILNAELWKRLIKEIKSVNKRVDIVWVRGHDKDIHNKAVDKLAKKSAKSFLRKPLNQVKLRRKQTDNFTKLGSIEMKGQRVSIHIITEEYLRLPKISKYRYEIISVGSLYFQKADIVYSELHHLKAGHKYIVTFNTDNKNPRILKVIKEIVKEENGEK